MAVIKSKAKQILNLLNEDDYEFKMEVRIRDRAQMVGQKIHPASVAVTILGKQTIVYVGGASADTTNAYLDAQIGPSGVCGMTLQQLVSFFGAFGLKISADDNGNVLLDASGNGRQGQLYLGNVKNLGPY